MAYFDFLNWNFHVKRDFLIPSVVLGPVWDRVAVKMPDGGFEADLDKVCKIYGEGLRDFVKRGTVGARAVTFYQGKEYINSMTLLGGVKVLAYLIDLGDMGVHLEMSADVRKRLVTTWVNMDSEDKAIWFEDGEMDLTKSELSGCLSGDWNDVGRVYCAVTSCTGF